MALSPRVRSDGARQGLVRDKPNEHLGDGETFSIVEFGRRNFDQRNLHSFRCRSAPSWSDGTRRDVPTRILAAATCFGIGRRVFRAHPFICGQFPLPNILRASIDVLRAIWNRAYQPILEGTPERCRRTRHVTLEQVDRFMFLCYHSKR